MARLREDSPSLDGTVAKKRVKTDADPQDPTSNFESADLVDPASIHKLHTTYVNNQPFKYGIVPKLFQHELLKKVKDEILGELHFSQKETDIYKACLYCPRVPDADRSAQCR
jgi:prolyl 3-hydroxylase /prolyl 3,4-dihydroxylase